MKIKPLLLDLDSDLTCSADWDNLIAKITKECHFNASLEFFGSPKILSPNTLNKQIESLTLYLEDFADNIKVINTQFSPIRFNHSIDLLPKRLSKKSPLIISELNYIANIIEACVESKSILKKCLNVESIIISEINFHHIHKNFIRPFREFVSKQGEVTFLNHPKIRPLATKRNQLDQQIKSELKSVIKGALINDALAYDEYDIINDHYTLPIKSDHYNASFGTIISRSKSGHTLHVSPYSIKDLSFKRVELSSLIQQQILIIESSFSNILFDFIIELNNIIGVLIQLDLLATKASYCSGKNFTAPIFTDQFQINLKAAYNPLISEPVKNDLFLASNQPGYIISGANTGGKSVFLKTIAMINIFAHWGMYVPADFAEIPLLSNVFFFSNKDQGISTGLSSFSSEVEHYLKMLKKLKTKSFIFIDEIFNSTSSEEGSALAYSLFNECLKHENIKIFSSTHHHLLKFLCHEDNRFVSAHVSFSAQLQIPTYKIIQGFPGTSMALEIFSNISSKIDIGSDIPKQSLKMLDNKHNQYEDLIQELNNKIHQYNAQFDELTLAQIKLKDDKKSFENAFKLKIQDNYTFSKKKIDQILNKSKSFLKELDTGKIKTVREYNHSFNTLLNDVKQSSPQTTDSPQQFFDATTRIDITTINIGQSLYSIKLGKLGKVIDCNNKKQQIQLQIQNFQIWHNSLELAHSKHHFEKTSQSKNQSKDYFSSQQSVEIDCRGMRLDEFEKIIEQSIHHLYNEVIPYLNVIHGHGNGVLKKWLRFDFLKANQEIVWDKKNSSNDGETTLILKR